MNTADCKAHEPFEGRCIHCDVRFVDGRPVSAPPAAPKRDNCEFCLGAKGGVLGNENRIGGHVVCDYCTPLLQEVIKAESHAADLVASHPAEMMDTEVQKSETAHPVVGLPCEDLKTALPEDARCDLAELNFYRRWGYPYTDHSTMCAKDHEGLCAITLPLSLPSPQSEGTCAAIVIRAFTIPQLYQKAVKHVAAIEAEYVQRYGPLPPGESAEAVPSNEKAPESGGATAMEVLTELVDTAAVWKHGKTVAEVDAATLRHNAAWDRAKALVSAQGATR